MWPKGTIVVCVDDKDAAPSGLLVEGAYYTIEREALPGFQTNQPSVHLQEFPELHCYDTGWYAKRFKKAESTYDESMVAQCIRIHRDIRDIHKILEEA